MPKTISPTITAVWAVLCSTSSIDQESNNISLYKVLEQINLTIQGKRPTGEVGDDGKIIAVPLPFDHDLVVLLHRTGPVEDTASCQVSIKLMDPKGNLLHEMNGPATFEKGKRRVRVIVQNKMFPITQEGEYRFEIFLENSDTAIASIPLDIVMA